MEDLRARTGLVLLIAEGGYPLPREDFRVELACLQLEKEPRTPSLLVIDCAPGRICLSVC